MEAKHTAKPYACRDATGLFLDSGNWNAENGGASRTEFVPIKADGKVIALVVREDWDSPELPATADFIVRACNTHAALVEYFNASMLLTMTLGHPEATAEDERKAEERYEAATEAARDALLSKAGAA